LSYFGIKARLVSINDLSVFNIDKNYKIKKNEKEIFMAKDTKNGA
jgi:hypothetical protein